MRDEVVVVAGLEVMLMAARIDANELQDLHLGPPAHQQSGRLTDHAANTYGFPSGPRMMPGGSFAGGFVSSSRDVGAGGIAEVPVVMATAQRNRTRMGSSMPVRGMISHFATAARALTNPLPSDLREKPMIRAFSLLFFELATVASRGTYSDTLPRGYSIRGF